MASLWNPAELDDMALPPCHYGFQVYINNNKLSLAWSQRSVDVFLGLPYDLAMYGLLLLMLAKGSGYKPGELICFVFCIATLLFPEDIFCIYTLAIPVSKETYAISFESGDHAGEIIGS